MSQNAVLTKNSGQQSTKLFTYPIKKTRNLENINSNLILDVLNILNFGLTEVKENIKYT